MMGFQRFLSSELLHTFSDDSFHGVFPEDWVRQLPGAAIWRSFPVPRLPRHWAAFSREPQSRWDLYQAEWAAQMHSSKPQPKTSFYFYRLCRTFTTWTPYKVHEVRGKWPYAMAASCWVEFLPELLTICPAMTLPKMKGLKYFLIVGIFKSKNIATCSMVYVYLCGVCMVLSCAGCMREVWNAPAVFKIFALQRR